MPPKRKTPKKKNFSKNSSSGEEPQIRKVRLPVGRETLGVLDQRLGASRVRVRCLDGHTRVCRIPGRLKRRLWVREGDIVIVEPWEFGGNEKGDVIYKYRPLQVKFLESKGYLRQLTDIDEF